MPTLLHEVLVEAFRSQPRLALELLRDVFGLELPSFREATIGEGDLTALAPTSYLTDLVITLRRNETVFSVIVEVQLAIDKSKPGAWLAYIANLYAKSKAPVVLLVVATDERVASFCEGPFFYGHPGFYLTPFVLGPKSVPIVTDEAVARELPELGLLSALAHSRGTHAFAVGKAALRATLSLDDDRGRIYTDLILSKSVAKEQLLEELIVLPKDYEYQTEALRRIHNQGHEQGVEQGIERGRAEALIAVLQARGFSLTSETLERVQSCRDVSVLNTWTVRAVNAESLDEVFADKS